MPADLKLKRKIRRTPAAARMKARRAMKKWEKGAQGKRFARIQKDPVKMVKHIRQVTIPKYKAWIKSAKAELKKATGPEKAEIKRKLDNHKVRLQIARKNLIVYGKRAKAARAPAASK